MSKHQTSEIFEQAAPSRRWHIMPYGAEIQHGVRFQLWAPLVESVQLELQGRPELIKMAGRSGGWFEVRVPDAKPGDRYQFVLPDGQRCQDPASRSQPDGPHGMSEVVDPWEY